MNKNVYSIKLLLLFCFGISQNDSLIITMIMFHKNLNGKKAFISHFCAAAAAYFLFGHIKKISIIISPETASKYEKCKGNKLREETKKKSVYINTARINKARKKEDIILMCLFPSFRTSLFFIHLKEGQKSFLSNS